MSILKTKMIHLMQQYRRQSWFYSLVKEEHIINQWKSQIPKDDHRDRR